MIEIIMDGPFCREELLIGVEGLTFLSSCRVAVIGLGGVGSFAAEALARAGLGGLVLVDDDLVEESNINRQLCALRSTIGRPKAEVMRERILDINPSIAVETHIERFGAESAGRLLDAGLSYIVDAIDSVSDKVELIVRAKELDIPIVSVMGTGAKLDPTGLRLGDIYETKVCPLSRVMRTQLRRRGVESLDVIYSTEEPIRPLRGEAENPAGEGSGPRMPVGSISFVPGAAGLAAASVVVRSLLSRLQAVR
jgi:tRNA A37 threonylcarbamoyladenosine dehydratase